MTLAGKVALVTGGGSGIGAACATALAREGATVVVAGRNGDRIDETCNRIVAAGGSAVGVSADFAVAADAEAAVARAVEAYGRLDIGVNAAGGDGGLAPITQFDEDDFELQIASNLKTVFLALKYEIPALEGAGGGAIVNFSSLQGLRGVRNAALYSAAKHGVIGLTKSAALETAQLGISVNAVCPGAVRTKLFERILEQRMPDVPLEEAAERFAGMIPAGRVGEPADVAETVVWLCGPSARYVTGAVIPVDGGLSA